MVKIQITSFLILILCYSCNKDEGGAGNECIIENISSSDNSAENSVELRIGGKYTDGFKSINECLDKGFILCGSSYCEIVSKYLVVKTDPEGKIIWYRVINNSIYSGGLKAIATTDNNYLIAGNQQTGGNGHLGLKNILLYKINSDGNTIWNYAFGLSSESYELLDIIEVPSGFLFSATSFAGSAQLINIDQNGIETKRSGYFYDHISGLNSLFPSSDGGFVACGYRNDKPPLYDPTIVVVKLNSDLGPVWVKHFDYGQNSYNSSANNIIEWKQSIYFTGDYHDTITNLDKSYITKFDQNGDFIWKVDFEKHLIQDLKLFGDGALVLLSSDANSYFLSEISPIDGSIIWQRSFANKDSMQLFEIQQTNNNEFVMVGSIESSTGSRDGVLIKTAHN